MASDSPPLTAPELRIDPEERIRGSNAAWRRYNRLPKLLVLSLALHVGALFGLNLLEPEPPTKIETATEIPIEFVTEPDAKPPPKPKPDLKEKPESKKKETAEKPKPEIEKPKPAPLVEKAEAKPVPPPQPKPITEAKTESKPQEKAESKPEPKPEPKPQQVAAKSEAEKSSGAKPPPPLPLPKSDVKPDATPKVADAKPPAPAPKSPPPPAAKLQIAAAQPKPIAPKPIEPKPLEPKPLAPAPKPQEVQAKPPQPVEKAQPPPPKPQLAAVQPPAPAPNPQASQDAERKPLSPLAREVRSQEDLLQQALGGTPPNGSGFTQSTLDPMAQPQGPQPVPGGMSPLPGSDDPMRAVAVPSPTQDGELTVAYKTLVFSKLELAKRFPDEARKRHAHGSAVIDFVLDDKGQVQSVTLVQSSGDPALDAESQAVVARAAPFPPPPPGVQKEYGAVIEFNSSK